MRANPPPHKGEGDLMLRVMLMACRNPDAVMLPSSCGEDWGGGLCISVDFSRLSSHLFLTAQL